MDGPEQHLGRPFLNPFRCDVGHDECMNAFWHGCVPTFRRPFQHVEDLKDIGSLGQIFGFRLDGFGNAVLGSLIRAFTNSQRIKR